MKVGAEGRLFLAASSHEQCDLGSCATALMPSPLFLSGAQCRLPFSVWFWLASHMGLCQLTPSLPCLFAFYQFVAYQNFTGRSSPAYGKCWRRTVQTADFISRDNPLPKIRFILTLS